MEILKYTRQINDTVDVFATTFGDDLAKENFLDNPNTATIKNKNFKINKDDGYQVYFKSDKSM